jgi:opacity protein-like surface antigen
MIATGVTVLPVSGVSAQSLGLGPRFSFVRSDLTAEGSSRYTGGLLRLRTSSKTAVELSIDYRNHLNASLTERIKDVPIQGSLLMYMMSSTLSPYLVGGIGSYSQRVQRLQDKLVVGSTKSRKTGYHAGLGADIRLGRHAAVHADYRYTFIGFSNDEGTEPGAVPIPGTRALQGRLKLSHKGSMWTSGVTMYF